MVVRHGSVEDAEEPTTRRERRGRGTAGTGERRWWAAMAAVVVLAVAVAGCSGTSGDSSGSAPSAVEESAEEFPGHLPDEGDGAGAAPAPEREVTEPGADEASDDVPVEPDDTGTAPVPPEARGTHLIRTAQLVVLTDDVTGAWADAIGVAERAGGFVSSEWSDQDRDDRQRSRLTLRVPPERYDEVLVRLSELGEVREREVSTEDVTGQVVDVAARIATQEESVARVRELMEEAESLADVVRLESELSTRQAELEALKARYSSLRERTGMGTITVELREPDAEEMDEDEEPGVPSPLGALGNGWDAFLLTLGWIAAVIGAALPFVVTVLLLWFGWRLLRSRYPGGARRRPAPESTVRVPPPPTTPPATVAAPRAERSADGGDAARAGGTVGSADAGTDTPGDGDGGDGDGGSTPSDRSSS